LIVLSNAGPLIALSKLNRLSVLSELYGIVHVPHTVQGEVVTAQGRPDACRTEILPFSEVELLILEIAARPDIWIGEKLCNAVLDELRPHS
jgi:predicted nucleic acid-binding protein